MPYWILAVTREVTWALKGQSAVPPSHPTNSVVCSNYSHTSHFWKPWKGRTQNTLHNGETLDTLTQVPIPNNQWQPIHSLIPTWLHFSPMLVIASQRISMHPLSYSLLTPDSWLALFAWNLILLQAGDLELSLGPRAVHSVSYPCTVCSREVRWGANALQCEDCERLTHAACLDLD